MPTWIGSRRVAIIPAIPIGVGGVQVGDVPADFRAHVSRRIFYDPDPNTNLDRSLRKYLFSVSYGRAWLDADILETVTVTWEHPGADPNPSVGADVGKTMGNAIAASQPRVAGYDYVMVVFPPGIPNIRSWAFWGGDQATSYVFLDNPLGAWAMELLHIVTEFGDLYGPPVNRPLSPGNLDEMDTSGAMHPSTFTKLRMGWLDAASVVLVDPQHGSSDHVLHPLALLQPAPDERATALRVPFLDRDNHYLLVEAREWLDEYDRNTPGLAEGIPIEGLAIYDVDESTWPPLWLKAQGLKDGAEYVNDDQRFKVKVVRHITGGGYQVSIIPLPEPQRCAVIRAEIADARSEIVALQSELHSPAANKPDIIRQIRELQRAIAMLMGEGHSLHCTL